MKNHYKKIVYGIVTVFIVVFIAAPIVKNMILSLTYNFGNNSYSRISGQKYKLAGQWECIFDTYQCGIDERHHFTYSIDDDSSGTLRYDFYPNKINGYSSNVFSYLSLLPYNLKESTTNIYNIKFKQQYLQISGIDLQDTMYAKYKMVDDKLFIDTIWEEKEYSRNPIWEFAYSKKLYYTIDLFKVWK